MVERPRPGARDRCAAGNRDGLDQRNVRLSAQRTVRWAQAIGRRRRTWHGGPARIHQQPDDHQPQAGTGRLRGATMSHAMGSDVADILRDAPKNWGRWGPDDEVGALNFLGPREVMDAMPRVRSGKQFTLQVPMADPKGDPVWPGRRSAE